MCMCTHRYIASFPPNIDYFQLLSSSLTAVLKIADPCFSALPL